MKKHYILYLLLLFLMLPNVVWSNPYRLRGMTMTDGLSDLLVNVIYKDSNGFIWLGTDKGLDRFDGIGFEQYSLGNTDARKRVYAITEDRYNTLWVGNDLGIWALEKGQLIPQQVLKDSIEFPVYSLFYENQYLYIGSERGLYIYHEKGGLSHILPDKNLFSSSNKIKGILSDKRGIIWLATGKGLYSYDPEGEEIKGYPVVAVTARGEEYRTIARIDDVLYLGTEGVGIVRFDIRSATFSSFADVGSGIISSLSTDGEDMLYAATDGNGVHFLSHSRACVVSSFQHDARDKGSIRSNSVYSLLVDQEGVIWFGFYQSGFDYTLYQNGLFQVYDFPPFFTSQDQAVRSFLIEENRKLIGTRDGLFYIDEEKKTVNTYRSPQLRSDLILSVCRYNDKYYVGTYGGGLTLIDVNTLTLSGFGQHEHPVFRNGHVFCLKAGPDGCLWMGTSAGVYRYNSQSGEVNVYNSVNSQMPEGNVYEIYFDSSGKGWICTEYGICIYDPESRTMKTQVFPEHFPFRDKYRIVYEDSANNIYLLPDKGSMVVTDLHIRQYERVEMHPAMRGNGYMSIEEDELGWFWIGGDDGIIRYNNKEPYYDVFNFKDGVPGQTFLNPSFRDEKGILWFSNAKGLVYVDPREVDVKRQNFSRIVFTDILLNGKSLSLTGKELVDRKEQIRLRKNENNLTFRFSGLIYSDPSAMVYEYMLEGLEDEWRLLHGKNEVSYYGLPAGNYVFRIRLPGNRYSESEVSLRIATSYPFLLAGGIVFILFLLAAFISNMKKRRIKAGRAGKEMPPVKSKEDKYKTKRLSEEDCLLLYSRLQDYMKEVRPYTQAELKLADLADKLDTSSHSLSYLFNQYMEQSYYDYINEYRIAEFKKLANDPQSGRYTLTAMAEMCGFSSRASFFRSFKKITGITPNEYINSLRKEE